MKSFVRFSLLLGIAIFFAACAGSDTNTAPQAIEAYLTALVNKDSDAVINAACADWEDKAKLEIDSFAAVTPVLDGLACTDSGADADGTLVTCVGVIKVTYNNEQQELPLEGRTYLAVEEGGEWRMCGYK